MDAVISNAAKLSPKRRRAQIHLVNSDPPYNVNVEPASNGADTGGQRPGKRPQRHAPSWRSLEGQRARGIKPPRQSPAPPKKTAAKGRRLAGDFVSDEEFARKLLAWFGNMARVLQPGRSFYLWGGYANIANYPPALEASALFMSQCVIWVKGHPVISRKDYMGGHEWCFYGWRKGAAHQFFGPNNVTDVWAVKKINPQQMEHLTAKPVELAVRAINYSSRTKENVLDLFGGSGSTLIGAEQSGRRAFLMEIDHLKRNIDRPWLDRELRHVFNLIPARWNYDKLSTWCGLQESEVTPDELMTIKSRLRQWDDVKRCLCSNWHGEIIRNHVTGGDVRLGADRWLRLSDPLNPKEWIGVGIINYLGDRWIVCRIAVGFGD